MNLPVEALLVAATNPRGSLRFCNDLSPRMAVWYRQDSHSEIVCNVAFWPEQCWFHCVVISPPVACKRKARIQPRFRLNFEAKYQEPVTKLECSLDLLIFGFQRAGLDLDNCLLKRNRKGHAFRVFGLRFCIEDEFSGNKRRDHHWVRGVCSTPVHRLLRSGGLLCWICFPPAAPFAARASRLWELLWEPALRRDAFAMFNVNFELSAPELSTAVRSTAW